MKAHVYAIMMRMARLRLGGVAFGAAEILEKSISGQPAHDGGVRARRSAVLQAMSLGAYRPSDPLQRPIGIIISQ